MKLTAGDVAPERFSVLRDIWRVAALLISGVAGTRFFGGAPTARALVVGDDVRGPLVGASRRASNFPASFQMWIEPSWHPAQICFPSDATARQCTASPASPSFRSSPEEELCSP